MNEAGTPHPDTGLKSPISLLRSQTTFRSRMKPAFNKSMSFTRASAYTPSDIFGKTSFAY